MKIQIEEKKRNRNRRRNRLQNQAAHVYGQGIDSVRHIDSVLYIDFRRDNDHGRGINSVLYINHGQITTCTRCSGAGTFSTSTTTSTSSAPVRIHATKFRHVDSARRAESFSVTCRTVDSKHTK